VPLFRALLHWVITLLLVLGCLRVWGINSFGWLSMKNIVVSKAVAVGFVIISAIVAWEVFAAFIERIMLGGGKAHHRIERSARTRTLLPLLKNVFLIFVVIIAGLIVLSEIGLDTGPLLAGAGVIGVALGFGSQSLVKDMITGIFILFENTIAVGEVVDLGNKHSGVVEALSIRSVKLRDDSGGIHTVPFSDVSAVTNLSRDFSYYLFTVGIDYRVDTDRVVDAVKEVAAGLKADPAFGSLILAPVDIWGVDGFGDNGISLKGAFKTRPLKQWGVGREFNRRLKKRLDELNIPMPMPRREIYQSTGGYSQG
jgi:small conductance mechanosensitive channel